MWGRIKDWINELIDGPDQEPFGCEECGTSGRWIIKDSLTDWLKIIECSKCHAVYIVYWHNRVWNFYRAGMAHDVPD